MFQFLRLLYFLNVEVAGINYYAKSKYEIVVECKWKFTIFVNSCAGLFS